MLNWQTIIPSNDPRHYVRGSEYECAFPDGFGMRFAIYAVRTIFWERNDFAPNGGFTITDCTFRIRDAATVSDADVRAGKRPAIFGEYATLDQALAAIEPHRSNDE